jgi:hypothetical protein
MITKRSLALSEENTKTTFEEVLFIYSQVPFQFSSLTLGNNFSSTLLLSRPALLGQEGPLQMKMVTPASTLTKAIEKRKAQKR